MASGIFTICKTNLMNGNYHLAADTINVALLTTGYTFSAATANWSSINGSYELGNGSGYITGGAALVSPTVTNPSAAIAQWGTSTNTSWTSATFTAYFAILYDNTYSSTTNNLICCIDFGGGLAVSSGTFTIQWSASGLIQLN